MSRSLTRDQCGAAAVEFSLALPPFVILLVGAVELGAIATARSGLQHAVNEGARYATLYPKPSDSQIASRVTSREFGLNAAYLEQPVITHGTDNGLPYTEIELTYSQPVNLIFFQTAPVSISYKQRAY